MKKSIFIFSFLLISSLSNVQAQPPLPGGGGGGGTPNCFPPPCVPIDGGLSWLLIAGVAYGGKKVFDLNKENPNKEG